MRMRLKKWLPFFLTVALTSLLCITLYHVDNKYQADGPQPVEGLLSVTAADLENPLYLVNGWAFYPDLLLTPDDFATGSSDRFATYTTIGEHTRFDSLGRSQNPHGSGTYQLHLRLPKDRATYALELPEIYSAYKLYVDGRLVLQMGDPDPEHYLPRTQNRMVTFDAAEKATILLAVSDYSHFYSGLVYPPCFGYPLQLDLIRGLRLGIALFNCTIALLGAALSIYFGLRLKDKNALLFSLLCIIMPIYTAYPLLHSAFALPVFPWYGLEMLSGYLISLLVICLHNRICAVGFLSGRISMGVSAAFCVLALCYGLSGAVLTVPVMKLFSVLAFLFKVGTALYLLITAIFASRDSRLQTRSLYYASIFYAVTVVWDRLLPEYEPAVGGWYSEWGSVILVVAIGYTLWREVVSAYRSSLTFASENRQMVRQLSMQTEYARQLQVRSEETRRLLHDFRQHIRTVGGLVTQALGTEDNQKPLHELEAYLAQMPESPAVTGIYSGGLFSENVAADSLLQYYHAIARQEAIETKFELRLPQTLPLTDVELCTVLGNLLENAVDACRRQTEPPRSIHIASQIDSELIILVENSYDGVVKQQGKRFLSRKSDGAEHGVGIESVRHILEHHGGRLHIYLQEKRFQAGIVLPLE